MTTAELRAELELRRVKLARSEELARTAAPRSRFAYAAAATKQRSRIARIERELSYRQAQTVAELGLDA